MVLPPPMAQLNVRLKLPTTKAARLWLECWVRDSSMTSIWEHIDAQLSRLKAVYNTVVMHNFNLREKTNSTIEVTTNFAKKLRRILK